MNRKVFNLTCLFLIIRVLVFAQPGPVIKTSANTSFIPGEELQYRVSFGFITVGKSITRVDKSLYTMNARPCYRIDAYGETSDWISWLSKVDDNWGAYLDTATVSTQMSYRKIREGGSKGTGQAYRGVLQKENLPHHPLCHRSYRRVHPFAIH